MTTKAAGGLALRGPVTVPLPGQAPGGLKSLVIRRPLNHPPGRVPGPFGAAFCVVLGVLAHLCAPRAFRAATRKTPRPGGPEPWLTT